MNLEKPEISAAIMNNDEKTLINSSELTKLKYDKIDLAMSLFKTCSGESNIPKKGTTEPILTTSNIEEMIINKNKNKICFFLTGFKKGHNLLIESLINIYVFLKFH